MSIGSHLRMWHELGKLRIATLTSVTMITGYILASGTVSFELLGLAVGVFLLGLVAGLGLILAMSNPMAMVLGAVTVFWYNGVYTPLKRVRLSIAGLWLVWRSVQILRVPREVFSFRLAFKQINVYACLVISLLSLSGLLG